MEHALLSIASLIIVAKIAEGVAIRLRQSALAAYVLAGILLGPVLGIVQVTGELQLFFGIGVVLLFFLIGVDEIDISGFAATIRGRFFIASAFAFLIPLALNLLVLRSFLGFETPSALALSGLLSLSSLGVVAKVLSDMGHLREPVGLEIFTTVIIVELVGLLLVGFTLRGPQTGAGFDLLEVGLLLGEIVAFIVVAWFLASRLFRPMLVWLRRWLGAPQLTFAVLVGGLLLVVVGAEYIGLHGSLGALLFGTALSGLPRRLRSEVMPGMRSIANGLFIPLFFASAGLLLDLSFTNLPISVIAGLVGVAVLSKLAGSVIGPLIGRLDRPYAIAAGLMAKGVVEIALLLVLLETGLISQDVFSLVTILMLAFLFLTPPIIGFAVNHARSVASPVMPRSIPPSFVRYAFEAPTVQDAIVPEHRFAPAELSVRDFMEQWAVPEQRDYVVVQKNGQIGVPVGIFSVPRLRFVPKSRWDRIQVGQLARKHFPRAYLDDPLDDALEKMADHMISVIPVYNRATDEFVSSVSNDDILATMLNTGESQEQH